MSPSIHCPLCQNPIAIKDPRPGRFRLKCPKCGRPFALEVPDGPDPRPVAFTLGPPTEATPRPAPGPGLDDPDATSEQAYLPTPPPPFAPPPEDDATVEEIRTPFRDPEAGFRPPRTMAGCRVGASIGETRSGAVFRARRWPFGGEATLAVVKPRWAADARFVARFAREAFAAAQLRHPNLATPRRVGVARGLPFALGDAPHGAPLSDPARGRAGLDRTARVAAILHAARALRAAHEQGLHHRGVTLGEIRVDEHGLVRLTGLGLGLTPDTPEVPAVAPIDVPGAAPSPPPEPPSAAPVRDDIAALGRALQTLIGGQQGDRAVPPGLAGVARRMAGEGPEPRFQDLGAVARALEAELGLAGPFAPRDEDAAELEAAARGFDEPPLARVRGPIAAGSAGLGLLLAVLAVLSHKPLVALGVAAFGLVTAWALVKTRGLLGGDPVFDRARDLALGGSRDDLLTLAAGLVLVVGALGASGLLGRWAFLGLLAGGLAAAYHFALDRPLAQARLGALGRARDLLRRLRRQGVDEDDLRRFACRQPGPRWEEFFEALFGYDAMRAARARWGVDAGGHRRPRFAPWREPVVDGLEAKLEARALDRDRAFLEATEERGAEARGINLLTARRKARRVAEAIVSLARQYRRSPDGSVGLPLLNAILRATERPDEFLAAAEELGEGPDGPPAWRRALDLAARVAFGPRARLLAGGVCLAGFLVWMNQNELINAEAIKRDVMEAPRDREKAVAHAEELGRKLLESVREVADASTLTNDLAIPHLPPALAHRLDGFGLGVAGLILVLSSASRGVRLAAFAVPGALVAALGPRLVEEGARPLGTTSLVAMAVGVGLFALGVIFGRGRD